jgi:hypothetical protein
LEKDGSARVAVGHVGSVETVIAVLSNEEGKNMVHGCRLYCLLYASGLVKHCKMDELDVVEKMYNVV